MRSYFSLAIRASVVLALAASTACIIEEDDGHRSDNYQPTPTTTYTANPPPSSTAPAPSSTLTHVSVQSDRTLTATPGQGAGIFVSYASGGHWSVHWTCDTSASGQTCAFDVSITSASTISNLSATPTSSVVAQNATSLRAQTTTGTTLDGLDFDVTPGSSIVLSATINGAAEPNLTFFVSPGSNGTQPALREAPIDPIELDPTTP